MTFEQTPNYFCSLTHTATTCLLHNHSTTGYFHKGFMLTIFCSLMHRNVSRFWYILINTYLWKQIRNEELCKFPTAIKIIYDRFMDSWQKHSRPPFLLLLLIWNTSRISELPYETSFNRHMNLAASIASLPLPPRRKPSRSTLKLLKKNYKKKQSVGEERNHGTTSLLCIIVTALTCCQKKILL